MRNNIVANLIPVDRAISLMDIRSLAQNEPKDFLYKIQTGVDSGKLKLSDIQDWKGLYTHLADVKIPVTIEQAGAMRAISTSAFPILTGTLAIAAINDAYNGVPSIGQDLVTDMEDNKKVTSIAAVHTLDSNQDEVKELDDFPEIGVNEEKVEIRHKRNGRRLTISAETIEENETADIVTRINALGEIAGEWIEEQTLDRIMDYNGSAGTPAEPYVYRPGGTGTQLYNSTANNPGTRAPSGTRVTSNALVDETDLAAVRTVLRAMKNARGRRINIAWSEVLIVVPDALLDTLYKIIHSEYVPGVFNEKSTWGPGGDYNIPDNRIKSSPKLDDRSTTAWYMGAFKRQFKRKWKLRFEYVTLGMDTQAYLNSRIAFQARLAWDMEVGATDYVYCVQSLSGTDSPYDD